MDENFAPIGYYAVISGNFGACAEFSVKNGGEQTILHLWLYSYRSEGSTGSDAVADDVRVGGKGGVVCVGRRGLMYEAGEGGRHEEFSWGGSSPLCCLNTSTCGII